MTHNFFGPRLDLHAIAWEVANTTDGFISEDLFIELIHADSAGMNCPDCPLFPLPPVSQEHADTYVIYDGIFVLENMEERDAVTLEADIILTLRYKLWHTQIESEKNTGCPQPFSFWLYKNVKTPPHGCYGRLCKEHHNSYIS